MKRNSSALLPRQPRSAPGQRRCSSIDRIMAFTETESLSLHCNGLALPAHMQHEAAAQRSAGAERGLGVKGVAFLGGEGHVAAPANAPPRVKKKKNQPASTKPKPVTPAKPKPVGYSPKPKPPLQA